MLQIKETESWLSVAFRDMLHVHMPFSAAIGSNLHLSFYILVYAGIR